MSFTHLNDLDQINIDNLNTELAQGILARCPHPMRNSKVIGNGINILIIFNDQ